MNLSTLILLIFPVFCTMYEVIYFEDGLYVLSDL